VESGWQAIVQTNLDLFCSKIASYPKPIKWSKAIELELFSNRFRSIAEQMGAQLQFSAFSVNVKERLDFSCAILDPQARLIANAPHIPVHLGSLGISARLILNDYSLKQGDVIICNHPLYGGSHLPDITLIKAVYSGTTLIGYVINRAHHAEIGGMTPGSMPPFAKNLSEEGVIFPPMYLIKKGKPQWEEIEKKLNALPYPSRNVHSNLLDIQAALLSLNAGEEKLLTLSKQFGSAYIIGQMHSVLSHSSLLMKSWMKKKNGFKAIATEYMDDGRILKVNAAVTSNKIVFDFKGTGPVHPGNLNANKAIVHSVVLYLLRLLVNENVPLNEGLAADIDINIPDSFIHPHFVTDPLQCPAVVGGNTEVSQRLTDTLVKAFRLAACSQGTMNNFLFGNEHYSYYETIGGGAGAGPGFAGRSAVHQHMTNTKITDPEELELRYPVRLERFEIRSHSGGGGKYKGGDGIIRQITFLEPMTVTILAQHRLQHPYGMQGGQHGALGKQFHITRSGEKQVSANETIDVRSGEGIRIETPGGGGWGKVNDF
jgi:5-oxoprolinase (ATP-hydrolysing)